MPTVRIWERDGVLTAVEDVLNVARRGEGKALFIVGEAGLGKTTLLTRAKEGAGNHGFRVGFGRGDAAESNLPFGIVDQALRELKLGDPLRLAEDAHWRAEHLRAARFYGVLQAMERQADRPLAVLLDDLHWADEDSLALVSFLCRRMAPLAIAVIGTLRPWPRPSLEMVQRLVDSGDAAVERLQPLSSQAAAALVMDLSGEAGDAESAGRAAQLAKGNPLLLEHFALDLRKGKDLPEDSDHTGGLPARILLSRFTGVSEEEIEYARAASILGVKFRPDVVAETAELTQAKAARTLEALTEAGVFRASTANTAEFSHPLLWQVLYDDMPAPVRAARHANVLKVLVKRSADQGELAEHALRARTVGDLEAVEVLRKAGRSALEAGAVARAAQLLEAAAEIAGSNPEPALLIELADTLTAAGKPEAAVRACRTALNTPDLKTEDAVEIHRMLGRALFSSDRVSEAQAEFNQAIDKAARTNRDQLAGSLLDQAFISWPTGGPALALPFVTRARALARDGQLKTRAETSLAFTAFVRGDPSGIPALEEAYRSCAKNPLADRGDFAWSWGTLGLYGNVAKWSERFGEAAAAYRVGIAAAEKLALPIAIAPMAVMHADTCLRVGRLHEALELADRATALADLAPERAYWAATAHAYVFADMGRMEECAVWWERARGLAPPDERWAGLLWLWHLEAVLAMHRRETEAACQTFLRLETLARSLEILEPCIVPWHGDAITSYLYAGRLDDALRVISFLEEISSNLPCQLPRIVVLGAQAAIEQAGGERKSVEAKLEESLQRARQSGMVMLEARLLARYGGLLRRAGELKRAREMLSQAVRIAEAAGAEGVAQKASRELDSAGGRHVRRRENPDELTPQEHRVMTLAAEGLKDKEIASQLFISANTVETHVQHVFRKLDISRRVQLILMRQQGRLPPPPRGTRHAA